MYSATIGRSLASKWRCAYSGGALSSLLLLHLYVALGDLDLHAPTGCENRSAATSRRLLGWANPDETCKPRTTGTAGRFQDVSPEALRRAKATNKTRCSLELMCSMLHCCMRRVRTLRRGKKSLQTKLLHFSPALPHTLLQRGLSEITPRYVSYANRSNFPYILAG